MYCVCYEWRSQIQVLLPNDLGCTPRYKFINTNKNQCSLLTRIVPQINKISLGLGDFFDMRRLKWKLSDICLDHYREDSFHR